MKKIFLFIVLAAMMGYACKRQDSRKADDFVRVENGKFMIGDSVYRFVGTNFWYGAILASEGRGGNRERLEAELDLLQECGINNLRILVGGDGGENIPSHIMPVLQTAPGAYNDTILDGLDYLLAQLEKRNMKAVLYLNNSWEWSGGYGAYLEWTGAGKAPIPSIDGYENYRSYVAQFVLNDSAKKLASDHVRNIVSHTNRYTDKPYTESPAIMSWQIANEPRAFASDSITKQAFARWISSQAALIKSLDPNHLVSTGSEGKYGCEVDIDLWAHIHADENIDYGLIHLWPYNWGWLNEKDDDANMESARRNAYEYISSHRTLMDEIGKPLVLEEFGYPRDNNLYSTDSSTAGRDKFYEYVYSLMTDERLFDGCNFWGWGGYAKPAHENWQTWDDYTGDPAQEPQGLNSVFATDTTTLKVIKDAAKKITTLK